MTSSFLMKLSFSQNQIFNKKWTSYANFFLVLCFNTIHGWHHIYYPIVVLNLVCLNSYRLFNVPGRKWWHQQKTNIFPKFLFISVTKLIFKVTCAKFASNWINIKQVKKDVSMALPKPNYLTTKNVNFYRVT